MNFKVVCIILIAAFASMIPSVSAVTIDSFEMQISDNGDTDVTFRYSLSPLEYIAIFMNIADPSEELRKVIDERTDREVGITDVSSGHSSFYIPEFIPPKSGAEGSTYVTPAIDFSKAEEVLNSYWFAPLITVDLSPENSKITFPDGFSEVFYNQLLIPPVTHTVR